MAKKLLVAACALLAIAGCSSRAALSPSTQGGLVKPQVRQTGEQPVQWRRFHWGSIYSPYFPMIVTGPDKAMWYNDWSGAEMIRMNMNGGVTRFPLPSFNPSAFAVGFDGKFYVGSQNNGHIDSLTTTGTVTQYTIPSGDFISYDSMVLGPDHNVWFTENAHIGKVNTSGTVTEYAYGDASNNNYYDSITVGPDNNLWVIEYYNSKLDKVTTAGVQTSFGLGCNPTHIISAKGSLWITCSNNSILQMTTSGSITSTVNQFFGFPGNGDYFAVGPDGNPWFATSYGSMIGEYIPSNNSMMLFYPPANYGPDNAIAAGSDGNVWGVDSNDHTINVYIINIMSVSPTSLTFPGTAQSQNIVVNEPTMAAWTATSSNTAIATVAQSSPADTFTVTSKAVGTCRIIVSDGIGNSFAVSVTVQ